MTATRRLVAIFYADVAGYSRLTGADEEGSHRRVMAVLDDVTARIADGGGEVLRYAGDAVLAVFPSVVRAVETSAAIQTALAERDPDLTEDQRVLIRIGINLGDVIEDRGEVYGDGVNLAARLEAAAEPGGICLSGAAHDQVEGKVAIAFTDGGEERFKNIARPVRIWRWAPGVIVPASGDGKALALPDKPSIAVLAFNNMSGDAEQEFFADGVTEDIITELSKYRSIFVIARNSSFAFKGRAVDIKQVGQELGVRYVLEGSVRKSAQRVRVTAQLIEATSGNHLWAERYDRTLDDVFALQDEITETIVAAIQPELESAERERARRKLPESSGAWVHYQRGMWHSYRATAQDLVEAERCFRNALAVDPHYALAHAGTAYTVFLRVLFQAGMEATGQRNALIDGAIAEASTSVRLDDREPFGQYVLGRLHSLRGNFDEAIERLELAVELNPNFALAYHGLGYALAFGDRADEAITCFERALRLSPADPYRWAMATMMAFTKVLLGQYESALDWARRGVRDMPTIIWPRAHMIAALIGLGREDEARQAAHDLLEVRPDFTIAMIDQAVTFKNPTTRERYIATLRAAGLPE
jgi:adenylate cyclase